jgi:hypothetical protein
VRNVEGGTKQAWDAYALVDAPVDAAKEEKNPKEGVRRARAFVRSDCRGEQVCLVRL